MCSVQYVLLKKWKHFLNMRNIFFTKSEKRKIEFPLDFKAFRFDFGLFVMSDIFWDKYLFCAESHFTR